MDERLRRRAREAGAGEDPAARLAAAQGLLRAGAQAAAWRALEALADDPGARAILADWPAWTHPEGDAGRTRFVDVEALTARPRVRWTAESEGATRLLTSPAGVTWAADNTWGLLDPLTGAPRRAAGARGAALGWLGARLLVRRGHELGLWDPAARRGAHTISRQPPKAPLAATRERLLVLQPEWLRALDLDGNQVWEHTRPPGSRLRLEEPVLGAGLALVQLAGGDVVRGLDLASGEERCACGRTAARADAAGVVAAGPRGAILCFEPDGGLRWSAPGLLPLAVAPQVVLAWDEAIQPVILDRTSGAVRARLPHPGDGVALARDIVYWWRDAPDARLGAVSWDGRALWDVALPSDPPRQVVPLPGALLLLTRSGTVLCLEPDD